MVSSIYRSGKFAPVLKPKRRAPKTGSRIDPDAIGTADPGSWHHQRAIELRNTPTAAETWIKKPLLRRGFARSVALHGFFADFYHPAANLVVEMDGPYHVTRLDKDAARDSILAGHGITTLRFPNNTPKNHLLAQVDKFLLHALPEVRNVGLSGARGRRAGTRKDSPATIATTSRAI